MLVFFPQERGDRAENKEKSEMKEQGELRGRGSGRKLPGTQ